ncbi:uncharacterized protein NECHADRAFT_54318 [Fusarium vanettenii 77-13-4]|uniref:Uncharacterized protein n=1 Tax=Fusarium vanettenii (strain ATCC MYA-4622 / CBS 123669 / FGSC 9596 / NRRL 45880 / 77-13-4) TaxID=660122 RepID=C7Z306_FUSV7|nr:uncharacterized protein NECHADRAFT_54318 [Fusarium vanettenii 77-13-4]EEU41574.1 hypothetical protein NECHADRAFT_54318 [Fusarium vanettenii 77-13-4]
MPKYQYPGLGLDLRFHDQNKGREEWYPVGIHTNCWGSESEMLLVREVAMMIVMDRLTDKPDWHIKVFDDTITEKWIEEGLALPVRPLYNEIARDGKPIEDDAFYAVVLDTILDRGCLEYCIKELRAKAEFFLKSDLIPTLDASSTVVKSDSLIDNSLHDSLRAAFVKLIEEQKHNPDWHPLTKGKVLDLVHPSLYPLVYGRTRVFEDEVVGVEDAIDKWAGKGEVIPEQGPDEQDPEEWRHWWETDRTSNTDTGGSHVSSYFWSTKYQWLPSNVELREDGSVKFTSYINNLHPVKHRDVYGTIEKLVEKALPAWDFCLKLHLRHGGRSFKGAGRTEPRFPLSEDPDDDNEDNWSPPFRDIPTPPPRPKPEEAESDSDDPDEYIEERDENGKSWSGTRREIAWQKVRKPAQPEAPDFEAWKYGIQPGDSLRERFDDLQIIVKMASIELTPQKPKFPAGGWHVEGLMNEHIVATALYYLDSENVTPSFLQFRMQTSAYQEENFEVGQDQFRWLEQVYGTKLRGRNGGADHACLQNYGSVETKQGRLLAFPNVFHHRVSPFELKDKTKPGHRRFIALWLVDPLTRVINTGNVPPQQQSWWMDSAFGNLGSDNAGKVPRTIAEIVLDKTPSHPGLEEVVKRGEPLPAELMEMVRDNVGDPVPMSLQEAKEHRLRLMEARSAFQKVARNEWQNVGYSFCEH